MTRSMTFNSKQTNFEFQFQVGHALRIGKRSAFQFFKASMSALFFTLI